MSRSKATTKVIKCFHKVKLNCISKKKKKTEKEKKKRKIQVGIRRYNLHFRVPPFRSFLILPGGYGPYLFGRENAHFLDSNFAPAPRPYI